MKHFYRLIIIIVIGFYGCYPANRISLIEPERQLDDICAMNTRVVVLQSYAFNVGFTIYHLPYGNYYPEGQDENGIYYKAPIPIVATGFSGTEEFVQSGIYLLGKSLNISSPFATFIYFNDDGSIKTELIYTGFVFDYGKKWYREAHYGHSNSN